MKKKKLKFKLCIECGRPTFKGYDRCINCLNQNREAFEKFMKPKGVIITDNKGNWGKFV